MLHETNELRVGRDAPFQLVSSHGAVLLLFATHPSLTWREAANKLGMTERHVARLVRDLATNGLLHARRDGRQNVYTIDMGAAKRHGWLAYVDLGRVNGASEA